MTFEKRVQDHLASLSPGQRKTADYILQNLEFFSYATLAKLSKEIAVSETTIIRLAYSLGFDSFSQMQNAVQKQLLQSPRLETSDSFAENDFYGGIFESEIRVIRNMAAHLDAGTLDQICGLLKEADMVLTVGARSSYNAAEWFGSRLYQLRDEVYVVQQFYDPRVDLLKKLNASSVVVCISMARYSKWTCRYAQIAKQRGAGIIALTDSLSSPLVQYADIPVIIESNRNEIGSNSQVALHVLFDVILARFRAQNVEAVARRLEYNEIMGKEFDLYYE